MEVEREVSDTNGAADIVSPSSDNQSLKVGGGAGAKSEAPKKGKSCKGCLYYSSTLKSSSRSPICVGVTRSLPQVPDFYVGESELHASKEGRSLTDFKYGCVGYSVYTDRENSGDVQETQTELPVCGGIEERKGCCFFVWYLSSLGLQQDERSVLVDKSVTTADGQAIPQRRTDGNFLSRFFRNGNVVAKGVANDVRKLANIGKKKET